MPYRLNPVKAVKKLGYSKRDIIGPSDKCFSICAAYSSRDDAYKIDPECAKQCEDFVEERRREVYGVGRCDHQAPYRPVIWDNIPRFVPLLLAKGKSPEEALEGGKKKCENVPNLYNECVDLCNLDYDAIENYDDVKPEDNSNIKNKSPTSSSSSSSSPVRELEDFSKSKAAIGIFIVGALCLLIIIVPYIRGKLKKE